MRNFFLILIAAFFFYIASREKLKREAEEAIREKIMGVTPAGILIFRKVFAKLTNDELKMFTTACLKPNDYKPNAAEYQLLKRVREEVSKIWEAQN